MPALDRFVIPGQFNSSPGLAKIAPYPPRHRDSFVAPLVRGTRMQAGWLRRVTFTTTTAGPLGISGNNCTQLIFYLIHSVPELVFNL
jgi:hypothetical protein